MEGGDADKLKKMGGTILNPNAPVAKRMHACFLLRQMGGQEAIKLLAAGLQTKITQSTLISHECAFLLGSSISLVFDLCFVAPPPHHGF